MATIGADPELLIKVNGRTRIAQDFDAFARPEGQRTARGNVGRDGSGRQLELRPLPSSRPIDIVRNLGYLMDHALRDNLPAGSELYVGSFVDGIGGLGGHLHTWGRRQTQDKLAIENNRFRVCLGLTLLWCLEHLTTGYTRRRGRENPGGHYGMCHDIRGGRVNPTWEFRSPSSDWLASPTLAYHSVQYFQSLVDNVDGYLRNPEEVTNLVTISNNLWTRVPSMRSMETHAQIIVNHVKGVVRAKDLTTIEFFAERLHRWRNDDGLIRLDVAKWRSKCAG